MDIQRRKTVSVKVGDVFIGSDFPVRVQSMANTNTNDIEASVNQAIKIIEAGAELVRFTAQGIAEAESLGLIHKELRARGYSTPLVADIHFNPAAAEIAARYVEKVRINPGNFVKSIKKAASNEYQVSSQAAPVTTDYQLLTTHYQLPTTPMRNLNRKGFCCAKNLFIF
jgi:(E)-4-hydroxy-3-methylbut-2-enyl-diphosphate synthase